MPQRVHPATRVGPLPDIVPAHMRHLEPGQLLVVGLGRFESDASPGDQAQSLGIAFGAEIAKHLLTNAYAEQRFRVRSAQQRIEQS